MLAYISYLESLLVPEFTNPVGGVQIEVLNLAMVEETGQPHAVVGKMRLFSKHCDVVLSCSRVIFQNLFAIQPLSHQITNTRVGSRDMSMLAMDLHESDTYHPQADNDELFPFQSHCERATTLERILIEDARCIQSSSFSRQESKLTTIPSTLP